MIICLMHREFDKMFSISVTTEYNNLPHKSKYSAMQKRWRDIAIFNESLHPLVLEYYLREFFTYCDNVHSFIQAGNL